MVATSDKSRRAERGGTSEFSEHGVAVDMQLPLSEFELLRIIEAHHVWLSSGSKNREGSRANLEQRIFALPGHPTRDLRKLDLRDARLAGANFEGADLSGVDLRGADLKNVDFGQNTNLTNADFRGSCLTGAKFGNADIQGALFQGANLESADLRFVSNFVPDQLSATILSRAEIPEEYRMLPGIDQVNKIVTLGRTTFFMMLAASIFTLFVIATTKDVELISGNSAETLPLVEFEIPVVGFVHLAPAIVLALYLYLTLYLVALLEEISTLPAVFTDNRRLDQHVDPWIMTSLICRFMPHLDRRRPSLSRLRETGAISIAWWVAPAVLGIVWLYYIRAHVLWGSFLHSAFFALAIVLGIETYRICRSKLKTTSCPNSMQLSAEYHPSPIGVGLRALLGITLTCSLSYLAITHPRTQVEKAPHNAMPGGVSGQGGEYSTDASSANTQAQVQVTPYDEGAGIIQYIVLYLDDRRFLDLSNASVSIRPESWRDPLGSNQQNEEELVQISDSNDDYYSILKETKRKFEDSGVRFVDLSGRDLRGVVAIGTFLVTSKLTRAVLDGADLTNADLRAADLQHIRGEKIVFSGAKLDAADLSYGELEAANFVGASMVGVNMSDATLKSTLGNGQTVMTGANLSRAVLNKTILHGALLHHTTFIDANLNEAQLQNSILTGAILEGAKLTLANLSGANLSGAKLSNANLSGANLSGADLATAINLTQSQLMLACGDAHTKLPNGLEVKICQNQNSIGEKK